MAFLISRTKGSQAVGMGKETAEKYTVPGQTFEEADAALEMALSRFVLRGAGEGGVATNGDYAAIHSGPGLWRLGACWRSKGEKLRGWRDKPGASIRRMWRPGTLSLPMAVRHPECATATLHAGSGYDGVGASGRGSGGGGGEGAGNLRFKAGRERFASGEWELSPAQV